MKPDDRPICRKCNTLPANSTGMCDGCCRDIVREEPPARDDFPDREGDFDDDWVGDAR